MAFQLVSLILAASTTVGAAGPIVYRNGVVTAVDPARRLLSVDLPDGPTTLAAGEDVDVGALRPGESVLVGVREAGGRAYAVRVRTAAAASGSPASSPASLPVEALGPGVPRRPLYVIPEHEPGVPARGLGRSVEPGEKVPAVSIMEAPDEPLLAAPEPAPAEPSRTERLRAQGEQELANALESVDTLAGMVDRAWHHYLAAVCPRFGSEEPRAWLHLPAGASAPDGTCATLLDRVHQAAKPFRERLKAVEDGARASWVPPGVVRKMLAERGLQ